MLTLCGPGQLPFFSYGASRGRVSTMPDIVQDFCGPRWITRRLRLLGSETARTITLDRTGERELRFLITLSISGRWD
jgi:hypothetical protein